MSELTAKIHKLQASAQAFWQERTEQERRMLTVGGAVLGLGLFYGVLIDPALTGRAKLRQDIPQLRQQEADLKNLAAIATELKSRTPIQTVRMSNDTLTASLGAAGLKAQSLALTGEYAKLELKSAPFAALAMWLDMQRRSGAITVQEATITGLATPGMVDANITLHQRAGAVQ
jgi:general secretion pathway protein M